MSQPLGTFVPRPAQTGDQFQARFAVGRPLFVQVVGVDGARQVKDQQTGANIVKKSVTVHVWDLVGGQISVSDQNVPVQGAPNTVYCNVLWMAGAIVDNLEPYVGAPAMPLKIVSIKGKSNFFYLALEGIEGPELQQMQAVFAADPTRIDREAAAKAQAGAAQTAAPAYQQSGFTPMQVAPSVPQGQAVAGGPGFGLAPAPNGVQPQGGQYPQQAPAAAQFQTPQPTGQIQVNGQTVPAYTYQQPSALVQAAAPELAQMANPVADAYQQTQQPWSPPSQAPAAPVQPQFQQAPTGTPVMAPPGQAAQPGIGHVQNSDVANILAGLAQQQPQQ